MIPRRGGRTSPPTPRWHTRCYRLVTPKSFVRAGAALGAVFVAVVSSWVLARPEACGPTDESSGPPSFTGSNAPRDEPPRDPDEGSSVSPGSAGAGRVELVADGRIFCGYSFDGHVHTAYSRDAHHEVAQVLELARRAGLDAVMITDHGSSAARNDLADYDGPLTVTVGAEFGGTFGHALTWDFVDANRVHASDPDDMPTLGRIAHERGAVVVLAHPGWWIRGLEVDPRYYLEYDTIRRGGEGESIDAFEIWNGTYPAPTSSLVDSWLALLEQGVYVPAVGGSDFHQVRGNAIGDPRNVVFCEVDAEGRLREPLDRCILEAARIGRLYVTDGPSLAFTVGGRLPGEILRAEPGARARILVRATSADGGVLRILRGREELHRVELEPGVPLEAALPFQVPDEDTFVHAEIVRRRRGPGQNERSLLANPIRIDIGAEVADWRGPAVTNARGRAPVAFRRRRAW